MAINRRVAALALLAGAPLVAQERAVKAGPPLIRTSGDAVVTAKPDRATLNIGVTTQAQTAQAAAAENARQLDAVVNAIRDGLGGAAELKTSGYAVTPDYRYPQPGGPPLIAGYTVTNMLEVKLNDVSLVSKLIDVSAQFGANTIHGVQFQVKEESGLQAQALREAATKARAKAEAIASALGLKIVRVISAEEGSTNVVRPAVFMAAQMRAVPTPVESGTVEVRAQVTLTVEVSP